MMAPTIGPPPAGGGAPTSTGRAGWHRRAATLPLAYLVGIVVIGTAHRDLPPSWPWLLIHLLLLGAVTNSIFIWGAHFTAAVLRVPTPPTRRAEGARLAVLNVGIISVLVGGTLSLPGLGMTGAPAFLRWLGVAGATAVFAAVTSHLLWLAARLRAALPARFAVTVHYYLAASVALLTGIPIGGWMLVVDDAARPRLLLFHTHVNLLGWVTLTVLGTLLTLWPTVLRTRMADCAAGSVTRALPLAAVGLALLGVGVLTWWPFLAVGGLVLFTAAVLITARPAVVAARQKPPASFATWSIAAGAGWLLVALAIDAWALLSAPDPAVAVTRFNTALMPLMVGFVAQVLIGALAYLLPVALGGGPTLVRERTAILDRHWAQRVAAGNGALAIFILPTEPYVRITTSLLVMAVLLQFLIPAVRVLLTARRQPVSPPATPNPAPTPQPPTTATSPRPLGALAVGLALVLVATVVGVSADRISTPDQTSASTNVQATGETTTVAVTMKGMRYHPNRITVPAGNRLIINLTNNDDTRHDLYLANGKSTAAIDQGATVRLDAGVIGSTVEGWCTLLGHRQAGMTMTITTPNAAGATTDSATTGSGHNGGHTAQPGPAPSLDAMAVPDASFTARDAVAPAPSSNRLHRVELRVLEVEREVAPGVRQKLWTFNGLTPGPVLRGQIGDTFEITLINDGTMDHGVDFHAGSLAPDQPMRSIKPGERLLYRFTAGKAGIWMYHCSTMPMLHHIGNGMYGAVIIDPPNLPKVDREYVLVQSEFYLGPDGQPGDLAKMQAEQPDAVVFNGYVGQYAHRPLPARAGERVRVWALNAGPNRSSSLHIVGAQFDTMYREGNWELRPTDSGGGQVLDLAPAAGGFVETVFPEAGHYPFVSHAMVDAERGARGIFEVR